MGAKPGGMKGNKQKAEYEEMEVKHGKPGGTEVERRRRRTGEAAERQKQEERGKEETES